MSSRIACRLLLAWPALVLMSSCGSPHAALRRSLTFHASYDYSADADFARGDGRLYTSPTLTAAESSPGLTRPGAKVATSAGIDGGGALLFSDNATEVVFYQAKKNIAYREREWGGAISMWLRLDPQKDLKPGFADPLQITDKKWNDASLFLDFSKDEVPRHFRLGVFCDHAVWNAAKRKWDDIPVNERPMVVDESPPFSRERWTHTVINFTGFNADENENRADLWINGEKVGRITRPHQTFTWDLSKTRILLGLGYIGHVDEVAIFNRQLHADDIEALYLLRGKVSDLWATR